MKHLDEYRDKDAALAISKMIAREAADRPMTVMEVCGTHTMAIARFGIRDLIPKNIDLISGPGCPVCVTPNEYMDHAIALCREKNLTVCTFGDMMKVPGSTSSLEAERGRGADVRIVYSTLDALEIARRDAAREVVFLGIGFETTAPTIAASIKMAAGAGVKNYSVLCAAKVVPPALVALMDAGVAVDGFLLPGHVSTVIGSRPYLPVFQRRPVAAAIAGFEPLDMLEAILEIVGQIASGRPEIHNSYRRAVSEDGNPAAVAVMDEVFEHCDAGWRGIGNIPGSGLKIRGEFARLDAARRFSVEIEPTKEPVGCRCGEILTGKIKPADCSLFGATCAPDHPIGACMVSSEGTCAAYYKYRRGR
jgi:hydrogenase expression/formation protein HypD